MKKICIISDLHGDLINVPEHDLLIICGDIVPLHIQRNFQNCINWLNGDFKEWRNKQKDVIIVWGNHDFVGYPCGSDQIKKLNETIKNINVTLLQDSEIIWNGIKIYGTPYGDYPVGWAFDEGEDKLKERYDKIPNNTDILITHTPPKLLFYDVVGYMGRIRHCGSQMLAMIVREKRPKYHFFGHIHEGEHIMKNINGTYYRNISLKDDNYATVYDPFVLEYKEEDEED